MSPIEHITLILVITLIASTTLATVISTNAYAQQEMTLTQTFETQDSNPNFWFQIGTLTIIIVAGLTTLAYLPHKKQKPQKPSHTTYSTLPEQQG